MSSTSFLPSTHGLHFANYWPAGTPALVVPTPLGNIPIGDAGNGLCGGFCFTARDLFDATRQPPSDRTPPATGSGLLNYLTWRLLASWNIPSGVLTYYAWATTPDRDTFFGARHGLARLTIEEQIPQITASIDQARPCPLGVVTVYSADPSQLGKCHQVLAYGYDWQGTYFRLRVYDPNSPDNDDVFIGLDTADPGHPTTFDSNVNIGHLIRGFFLTPYTFSDPSAIAGAARTSADDPRDRPAPGRRTRRPREAELDRTIPVD